MPPMFAVLRCHIPSCSLHPVHVWTSVRSCKLPKVLCTPGQCCTDTHACMLACRPVPRGTGGSGFPKNLRVCLSCRGLAGGLQRRAGHHLLHALPGLCRRRPGRALARQAAAALPGLAAPGVRRAPPEFSSSPHSSHVGTSWHAAPIGGHALVIAIPSCQWPHSLAMVHCVGRCSA